MQYNTHKKQLILNVRKESKQWQLKDENFWNMSDVLSDKIHKQLILIVRKESKKKWHLKDETFWNMSEVLSDKIHKQ